MTNPIDVFMVAVFIGIIFLCLGFIAHSINELLDIYDNASESNEGTNTK